MTAAYQSIGNKNTSYFVIVIKKQNGKKTSKQAYVSKKKRKRKNAKYRFDVQIECQDLDNVVDVKNV